MNRQVLPSMLLSVLIVCASAVALRPIEGDRHRASDPADATASDSAPASPQFGDEPEAESIPSEAAPAETATGFEEEKKPEAADPESQEETPEPEPAPMVEPDASDPLEDDLGVEAEAEAEVEAEKEVPPPLPLPEATEPFDEADESVRGPEDEASDPAPAFDDPPAAPPDEPVIIETGESLDEPPGALVGPPIEAASREETPVEEVPTAPESPPPAAPSAPSAIEDEDAAEPSPSPRPGSIRIPRSDSMWGVPARVDRPREPTARVREPGGAFEPARRSDAMRTRPFLWTPRP